MNAFNSLQNKVNQVFLVSFIVENLKCCLVVVALVFASCAEKEVITKAHPATSVNDVFGLDNGMPIREVQKKNFYFKKCELESRRPFPSKVEFSCNEN